MSNNSGYFKQTSVLNLKLQFESKIRWKFKNTIIEELLEYQLKGNFVFVKNQFTMNKEPENRNKSDCTLLYEIKNLKGKFF